MKLRLVAISCLVAALCPERAAAQQDPSFSHYWAMETSFTPAAVGKRDVINVTGAYNMTLAGFEHNPRTMYVSADMPFMFFRSRHGAGLQIVNDQIGLFRHQKLAVQYAYKPRLFGGTLSVGLQAGLLSENFDGSGLELDQPGDPAFATSEAKGTGLDLCAGLHYMWRGWYLGASALHLTAPTILIGETTEMKVGRSYYLTAGGNIKLRSPLLSLQPSVLARTDEVGWRVDCTCRMTYTHENTMLYAGLGYAPTISVTAYIGALFHGVIFGYSYEAYTSAVKIGNGSHELFVGYQTPISLKKKGKNRHQTPRIL